VGLGQVAGKGTRPQTKEHIECLFSFRFVDCAMRLHTNEMYVLYRTKLIGHLIGSAPPSSDDVRAPL